MKVVILATLEGVGGVRGTSDGSGTQIVEVGTPAKQLLVNEINACIDGLRDAGVDEIIVRDLQPDSGILTIHDLRPGTMFMTTRDATSPRIVVDAGIDALIVLGAYAMNNTQDGFLSHTMDAKQFESLELNGSLIGDLGMIILNAAYFGVPTILVSGDSAACREAECFCGKIETVVTKQSLTRYSSLNRSIKEIHSELKEKSIQAIRSLNMYPKKQIFPPYELKIRMQSRNFTPVYFRNGAELPDEKTVLLTSDDFLDLYAQLWYWAPGAHKERFGITAKTNDYLTVKSLD